MEKLKLYFVDNDYIDYLREYERNVLAGQNEKYVTERKYIGVVLEISDFKYFAPLSSPKESDFVYIKGVKTVRKSIIPLIRLTDTKGKLLGKIKLNNMIPVPDRCITLYDVENEADIKYKDLIKDEIICIRKNKALIMKNAQILYNQKVKNYSSVNYLNSTVDFLQAEKLCKQYQN